MRRTSMGPVDYLVVAFPGNQFKGEIAPALADLVDKNTIRILDLVFVIKDEKGDVEAFELQDMPVLEAVFEELTGERFELLSEEDTVKVAETLPLNTSAAVLVYENLWAEPVKEAIERAGGQLVAAERIPAVVIEEAFAALVEGDD
jgi:Family of unknown function (DUF6325)